MKTEIIDAEQGIVACKQDEMLVAGGKRENFIFCYYCQKDWIVFNAEHKDYKMILELIRDYMEFDDLQKKEFMDYIKNLGSFKEMFDVFNQILRVRKNIRKRKYANK